LDQLCLSLLSTQAYQYFRNPEILRLASIDKIKPVHYISTVAVFESPAYAGKIVTESDRLLHREGMKLAYSQSKWVAEKLMMIASDRGIPVSI
jgi:thioester reductase-like protein